MVTFLYSIHLFCCTKQRYLFFLAGIYLSIKHCCVAHLYCIPSGNIYCGVIGSFSNGMFATSIYIVTLSATLLPALSPIHPLTFQ
jgi:hypothetical protein